MITCLHGQLDQGEKATLRKKHQLRGGFEYIFVNGPPEKLQTESALCV